MPTQQQRELYRKLHAMFGVTADFRAVADGRDILRMSPQQAYVFLSEIFDATRKWKYKRLPRYAGLPRTADERRASLKRALKEEAHARLVCPDDERETWCADTRPSAMGFQHDYMEAQDELKEAIEMDRGFFRPWPQSFTVTRERS